MFQLHETHYQLYSEIRLFLARPGSAEDGEVISEMRRLFGKVEDMKQQRVTYEAQLREQMRKDDVTAAIVTQQSTSQEVGALVHVLWSNSFFDRQMPSLPYYVTAYGACL